MHDLNISLILGLPIEIDNTNLLRFIKEFETCSTYKDIKHKILHASYLSLKEKFALFDYFRDNNMYNNDLFNGFKLMRYIKTCLRNLPFSKKQKMEVEYAFSKTNKDRFEAD